MTADHMRARDGIATRTGTRVASGGEATGRMTTQSGDGIVVASGSHRIVTEEKNTMKRRAGMVADGDTGTTRTMIGCGAKTRTWTTRRAAVVAMRAGRRRHGRESDPRPTGTRGGVGRNRSVIMRPTVQCKRNRLYTSPECHDSSSMRVHLLKVTYVHACSCGMCVRYATACLETSDLPNPVSEAQSRAMQHHQTPCQVLVNLHVYPRSSPGSPPQTHIPSRAPEIPLPPLPH